MAGDARPFDAGFKPALFTASPARLSSPAEHGASLGAAGADAPRPEAQDCARRRIAAAARRLGDSWIGDLIGAACIAGALYGSLLLALVLE